MTRSIFYLFVLLLSFQPLHAADETLTGKVVGISDGDTITILDSSKRQHKIRLYGIDSPESGQPFGKAAKKHTAKLTARKTATVKAYDTDRYGRTVGVVSVNGVNVNHSLIENGYAWHNRKYCKTSFCRDWLQEEKQAKHLVLVCGRMQIPCRPGSGEKAQGIAVTRRQEVQLHTNLLWLVIMGT